MGKLGEKLDDLHRKTATEVHSSTPTLTCTSPGRHTLLTEAQFQAFNAQSTPATNYDPIAPEAESPIENTGIKVGEIIGWRCWEVSDGWLYSVVMDSVEWEPGEVLQATNAGFVAGYDPPLCVVGRECGIHAFKSRKRAIRYATGRPGDIAVGKVALWGEIWEFEDGWHGEFARVESIDFVFKGHDHIPSPLMLRESRTPTERFEWWKKCRKAAEPALLDQLRETYGLMEEPHD